MQETNEVKQGAVKVLAEPAHERRAPFGDSRGSCPDDRLPAFH